MPEAPTTGGFWHILRWKANQAEASLAQFFAYPQAKTCAWLSRVS